MKKILLFAILAVSLFANEYFWTQINKDSKYEFRVVNSGNCPAITCDGKTLQTSLRFQKNSGFDVNVCAAEIEGCKNVTYQNKTVTLPKKIKTIAIIGDTGCRIKIKKDSTSDKDLQNCRNKDAWPAEKIAQKIAAQKPDLIIHVGDYQYREKCENPELCKDVEMQYVGYDYKAWKEDFLKPFANILGEAPWIFIRGNHEDCDRAWQGYKAMLSPYPYQACDKEDDGKNMQKNASEPPYTIDLDDIHMVAMDSAGEDDKKIKEKDLKLFEEWFDGMHLKKHSWILTHKPVYDLNYKDESAQEKAFKKSGLEPAKILSGHIHLFEWVKDGKQEQLVVGNSGTKLDDLKIINTKDFDTYTQYDKFGYVIAVKEGKDFNFALYSDDGQRLFGFK